MKRKLLLPALALCLLLTGCGWFDGSYVSVTPRKSQHQTVQSGTLVAADYMDLIDALDEMISKGTESAPILVADYQGVSVDTGMSVAVEHAMKNDPIGAYAVEDITYELGTSGGVPAVAVNIAYRHSRTEIQRIHQVKTVNAAQRVVAQAMEGYATGLVMYVETYTARDFTQMVQDYCTQHPETVMETPQVTETVYGTGRARVVDLIFTYQNSRDALRQMRSQVKPVFDAASLYVSGSGGSRQKYSQLYGFLMERFAYQEETSITPSYSLLCHGVGDSRAFAMVYAAMCRNAGLECSIVTGTRSGQPYTWNIIMDNGQYYHVDLLKSHSQGRFCMQRDWEMSGYVWDYSAYPACSGEAVGTPAEPTEETVETTAETIP